MEMLAQSIHCIHELSHILDQAATVNDSNSELSASSFNSVYQYEQISIPSYIASALTPCLISLIVVPN